MLEKNIEKITKSERNFPPTFFDYLLLSDINFNGHCLINNNISILKKVINLCFPYTLSPGLSKDFTLKNWLFGYVKLTQNAVPDNTKIVALAQDLISIQNFHLQIRSMGKMSLFFKMI